MAHDEKYQTYFPKDILKPYIRLLAISESTKEKSYKVLPGTEVVIGFQYKGKLSYIEEGKEIQLSNSGLTGLRDRYRQFQNVANTGTVLVFFKEGGLRAFFKHPLHELFRESISLDLFMLRSELLIIEEKLQEAKSDKQKIGITEDFLVSKLNPPAPDLLVMSAISIIYKNKGNIRISELLKQLNTSQSPLEKRFRQTVGTTPKKFAEIVRFKNVIAQFSADNTLTELGFEAGYYDQAHFIKEFRNFTGENPEAFFKS